MLKPALNMAAQPQRPSVRRAREASKLLARGSGFINLSIEGKQLKRSGLQRVAQWARKANQRHCSNRLTDRSDGTLPIALHKDPKNGYAHPTLTMYEV